MTDLPDTGVDIAEPQTPEETKKAMQTSRMRRSTVFLAFLGGLGLGTGAVMMYQGATSKAIKLVLDTKTEGEKTEASGDTKKNPTNLPDNKSRRTQFEEMLNRQGFIERLRKGTVQVEFNTTECSGVILGPRTLLIATHCQKDDKTKMNRTIQKIHVVTETDKHKTISTEMFETKGKPLYGVAIDPGIEDDDDIDRTIIVFETDIFPAQNAISIAEKLPAIGEAIATCGNRSQLGWNLEAASVTHIGKEGLTSDAQALGGDSGGAATNAKGELIGIVVKGDAGKAVCAITTKEKIAALQKEAEKALSQGIAERGKQNNKPAGESAEPFELALLEDAFLFGLGDKSMAMADVHALSPDIAVSLDRCEPPKKPERRPHEEIIIETTREMCLTAITEKNAVEKRHERRPPERKKSKTLRKKFHQTLPRKFPR